MELTVSTFSQQSQTKCVCVCVWIQNKNVKRVSGEDIYIYKERGSSVTMSRARLPSSSIKRLETYPEDKVEEKNQKLHTLHSSLHVALKFRF